MSGKRTDYISWEQFFMEVAQLAARRSKDPCTQVGACIVDDNNRILGIGYNGFPRGISDDKFSWTERKHLYVVHAEANALMNVNNFNLLTGSTMYCTLFPCNECAKLIIQLGVKKIIYLEDRDEEKYRAAKRMLNTVEIEYIRYVSDK